MNHLIEKREDCNIFKKALDDKIINFEFSDKPYVIIKDCILGMNWKIQYYKIPSIITENYFNNYIPKRWTYNCVLSQEEFFKYFTIHRRNDYEIFDKAEKLGILKYKVINKVTMLLIKDCIKQRIWTIRYDYLDKVIDENFFINFKPQKWSKNYNITRTEFFKDYVIGSREDSEIFYEAEKLGILKFDCYNRRVYVIIKDCIKGL